MNVYIFIKLKMQEIKKQIKKNKYRIIFISLVYLQTCRKTKDLWVKLFYKFYFNNRK